MVDHSTMHLGKHPARRDARTLRLARYVQSSLPPAPAAVDYSCAITDWGLMLNDQLGCCTIAGVAHAVQVWTANAGTEVTVPDSVVLNYYQTWDGYNPANPATDQGGTELDVLNDWHQQGFSGRALDAYGALELDAGPHLRLPMMDVMDAIWLFGGAYIGLELPLSAQNQEVWGIAQGGGPIKISQKAKVKSQNSKVQATLSLGVPNCHVWEFAQRPGGAKARQKSKGKSQKAKPTSTLSPGVLIHKVWEIAQRACGAKASQQSPDEPGSWGGHAVYVVGYDSETLTCITWGQLKKMTWAWFAQYCSEAYGLVSKDWLKASGISPSGFDLATLEADLAEVSGG